MVVFVKPNLLNIVVKIIVLMFIEFTNVIILLSCIENGICHKSFLTIQFPI
jgi:hypothetical protein